MEQRPLPQPRAAAPHRSGLRSPHGCQDYHRLLAPHKESSLSSGKGAFQYSVMSGWGGTETERSSSGE